MKYDIQEFNNIIEKQIYLKKDHLLRTAISSNSLISVQSMLKKYNRYSVDIIKYAFNCFLKNPLNQKSFQILQSLITEVDYTRFKEEDITQVIKLFGKYPNTLGLLNEVFFHIRSESHLSLLMEYKTISCNLQDQQGRTALHCAVQNNRILAVKALVSQPDIDISLKDNNDFTALDYAIYNQNTVIINILQNHQDNVDMSTLFTNIKKYLLSFYEGSTSSNSSLPSNIPLINKELDRRRLI